VTLRITRQQQIYASIDGFVDATERHAAASGLRETFVPLAEALYWAATIDDNLRFETWYEPERAAHPDGCVMPGIRYARNFSTHEIIALTEAGPAYLTFPLFKSGSLYESHMLWLPFEDLPSPRQSSKFTVGQQESYRTHLAGHTTPSTLSRVQSWLTRVGELALD
jgi:hypothetical protein